MKVLHVLIYCCCSVACVEASAVLEVSGNVGGEVIVHCSGSWTTHNSSEHNNAYFCKGVCSKGSTVIQTERKMTAVTRQGRYSMEVNSGDGAFNVTIKRLKKVDAGRYHCGVGKALNVLYQEVNLIVLNPSTVRPGPPPSTTTLKTGAETLTMPPSAASSPATGPTAEEKTKQRAETKLTDTTVVIIVSVSLALLVCAIIPLIFYGHCRSNQEGQHRSEANKGEDDCCEENANAASTPAAVRLQCLAPAAGPESCVQDASQYTAVYQALDPKSLE